MIKHAPMEELNVAKEWPRAALVDRVFGEGVLMNPNTHSIFSIDGHARGEARMIVKMD